MDNIIDTQKVNRSLFAYRVVDVHNDEFGFAQDGVIYTYVTENNAKTKGTAWLRMQKAGEDVGDVKKKYLLFFGDETEHTAYIDKHNDIYDLEGNYVASLVNSRFILFLFLFIGIIVLLTGLAMYLGGSVIMDTSTPFSQDQTIHIESSDSTDGSGQAEQMIDILSVDEDDETEVTTVSNNDTTKAPSDRDNDDVDETTTNGAKGSVKSKTSNKSKVIYPGYQSEYVFYIQNDGTVPLTYQVSFSEENTYGIPMRYKLMIDDEYYAGDEDTWVDVEDFNVKRQAISSGDIVEYKIIFEWEDKDTEEANAFDTQLGIDGIAEYKIQTTVYFEDII